MEAKTKLTAATPASQFDLTPLADGMRTLTAVLRRLLGTPSDGDGSEETPHWSESADWQDHLSQFEDKGVRP